jgi:hypothetical protein
MVEIKVAYEIYLPLATISFSKDAQNVLRASSPNQGIAVITPWRIYVS